MSYITRSQQNVFRLMWDGKGREEGWLGAQISDPSTQVIVSNYVGLPKNVISIPQFFFENAMVIQNRTYQGLTLPTKKVRKFSGHLTKYSV